MPNEHEYGNGVSIFTRDSDTARDFVSASRWAWWASTCRSRCRSPTTPSAAGSGPVRRPQPAQPVLDQFYTKVQTVTGRWPSGIRNRGRVHHPDHEIAGSAMAPSPGRRQNGSSRRDLCGLRRQTPGPATPWVGQDQTSPSMCCGSQRNWGSPPSIARDVSGSGLRRIDAVRIFEQLAIADPVISSFISIHNMCAWMIDIVRHPGVAPSPGYRVWRRWNSSPVTA